MDGTIVTAVEDTAAVVLDSKEWALVEIKTPVMLETVMVVNGLEMTTTTEVANIFQTAHNGRIKTKKRKITGP